MSSQNRQFLTPSPLSSFLLRSMQIVFGATPIHPLPLRVRLQTTLTSFGGVLTTYLPPSVDIVYVINFGKKLIFLAYRPIHFYLSTQFGNDPYGAKNIHRVLARPKVPTFVMFHNTFFYIYILIFCTRNLSLKNAGSSFYIADSQISFTFS